MGVAQNVLDSTVKQLLIPSNFTGHLPLHPDPTRSEQLRFYPAVVHRVLHNFRKADRLHLAGLRIALHPGHLDCETEFRPELTAPATAARWPLPTAAPAQPS